MIQRFVLGIVTVAASFVASPTLRAADGVAAPSPYGEGMQAFYRGDYRQAADRFTQAIDAGSADPRCYYFRGLAQARLGRGQDAQLDFQKGAELEANDFDVFYNTSTALERIQGQERIVLESYRKAGRKKALAEIEKIRFEHYRRYNPSRAVAGAATTGAGTAAPPAATPGAMPASPMETPDPFNAPAAPAETPAPDPFGTPAPTP